MKVGTAHVLITAAGSGLLFVIAVLLSIFDAGSYWSGFAYGAAVFFAIGRAIQSSVEGHYLKKQRKAREAELLHKLEVRRFTTPPQQ